MAMTPAHDAFTLNNRYSRSHSRRSPRSPTRSPSPSRKPVSMGIGKLARRNSAIPLRRLSHGASNGTALHSGDSIQKHEARRLARKALVKSKAVKIDWEIPRKTFHASIGFFVIPLYTHGFTVRPVMITLSGALVIIIAADVLRFKNTAFEQLYERCVGFLMRESEKQKINGVVWYILGVLIALGAFPLDIAVTSILILSWADTTASTFGRLWGRYTPSLPSRLPLVPFLPASLRPYLSLPLAPRKSLAGFIAATVTASAVVFSFWGWLAPFRHSQALWHWDDRILGGWAGLTVVSAVAGLIAGVAEALDLGSLDDNLTLPVISGGLLWGFLRGVSYLF